MLATIAIVLLTMLFLSTRPVAFGFRLPQKITSNARYQRHVRALGLSLPSSSPLSLSYSSHLPSPLQFQQRSVPTLSSGQLQFYKNHIELDTYAIRSSRKRILLHARRSTASSSKSEENSVSPTVEVSPSDHGTVPLQNFEATGKTNNDKNGIPPIDDRLLKNLKLTIGSNAKPTPIQAHAIPLLLNGHDVMASSPTGSGKSIMFGLPLIQKLVLSSRWTKNSSNNGKMGTPRALVISPTRELAAQTASVLHSLIGTSQTINDNKSRENISLNVCLATGGSDSRNQRQKLPSCDVLVGTPGRILQFSDERKLSLGSIDYLVIDEADRMLDLGFEPQLARIARSLGRGKLHQSILCSATFPEGVQRLAADFLIPEYYFVSVGRVGSTHANIRQRFEWVNNFYGDQRNRNNKDKNKINRNFDPKEDAVVRNVQRFWDETRAKKTKQSNVIVFTNTKDASEQYGKALTKLERQLRTKNSKSSASVGVRVIHGDKLQSERNRAIEDFKSGKATTLVATDIAARGLDISTIGLVVQADTPRNIDTYTHRVGRTGRAGASGEAVTLIDAKNGFGITSDLVNLLKDADQGESIPSWLQGMAHIANARLMQEEIAISAGSSPSMDSPNDVIVTNEEFTGQDFRRTAVEGSYGAGRDTSFRAFDEAAYENGNNNILTPESDGKSSILFDADGDDLNDNLSSFREENGEEPKNETKTDAISSFQRKRPSQRLLDIVRESTGSSEIGVMPDKGLIDSLSRKAGGNQKLKFEYIGMFPFDLISPFLMSQPSNSNDDKEGLMPRILMVAEKPSIAKAMAEALSGRRGPRQRRGISRALPVYEFVSESFQPVNDANNGKPTKCIITVTSVVGHIFSLGFDTQNQTQSQDPQDYFHLPVVKQEETTSSKLRVMDHLRALAGKSDHLVLWLDCDPEGENIAHEVMAITRQAINSNNDGQERIHRARFSAISPNALRDAFASLEKPDPALSRAVDARQELDLRIGVALTRLLTWRFVGITRKRFDPSTRVVSYGPCQTPALSFCVNRAREIEDFEREPYSKVNVEVAMPNGSSSGESRFPLLWKVPQEDAVVDMRGKRRKDGVQTTLDCASYNKIEAERLVQFASSVDAHVEVNDLRESSETILPPLGLNTVALLEAGSKSMGMSPKQVMNVAEKLYSAGFISYPRTETTKYDPNGFDVRSSLRDHANHPEWGRTASYLLRTKYSKSGLPPRRGKDVGDHPPITPLRSATREQVGGGAAWRVYEFVVRNFLGSLHNELLFTRRTASLSPLENKSKTNDWFESGSKPEFKLELVTVDSLGFTDCCRWVLRDIGASGKKDISLVSLKEGDVLPIRKASKEDAFTKPPRFLQEHELILLMDENRIGTDASMAVHVSNIVERGYVKLYDETGQPLRGPRRPGSKPLPRQIGRYMVPTALGMGLLDIFDGGDQMFQDTTGEMDYDSPALLSMPSIRRQMEDEVKQIAMGTFEKDYCLEKNLDWFEERYIELEGSLNHNRVKDFGKSLSARKDDIRRWKALGAFDPKKSTPTQSNNKTQRQNNNKKQANHRNGKKDGKYVKGRRKNHVNKNRTTQKAHKSNAPKRKATATK